jgi:hypothetical protein
MGDHAAWKLHRHARKGITYIDVLTETEIVPP